MSDRQQLPWVERPTIRIDAGVPLERRFEQLSKQRLTVPGLFTLVGRENDQRVVIERAPNKFALCWGEPDSPLITTNDYRKLYKTETHDSAEIYRSTCARYDTLSRFFPAGPKSEISDEQLLYVLSDRGVIQSITAQHIILRPRQGTVRLFVPRKLVDPQRDCCSTPGDL